MPSVSGPVSCTLTNAGGCGWRSACVRNASSPPCAIVVEVDDDRRFDRGEVDAARSCRRRASTTSGSARTHCATIPSSGVRIGSCGAAGRPGCQRNTLAAAAMGSWCGRLPIPVASPADKRMGGMRSVVYGRPVHLRPTEPTRAVDRASRVDRASIHDRRRTRRRDRAVARAPGDRCRDAALGRVVRRPRRVAHAETVGVHDAAHRRAVRLGNFCHERVVGTGRPPRSRSSSRRSRSRPRSRLRSRTRARRAPRTDRNDAFRCAFPVSLLVAPLPVSVAVVAAGIAAVRCSSRTAITSRARSRSSSASRSWPC